MMFVRSLFFSVLILVFFVGNMVSGQKNQNDKLANELKSDFEKSQLKQAEAIRIMRDSLSVDQLIVALGNENNFIRETATQVLSNMKNSVTVEKLIVALKNDNHFVRYGATRALGEIGDNHALEQIINTLKDEDDLVRVGAVVALGKLKDSRAIKPLTEALNGDDVALRAAAASSLGKIGDRNAIPILVAALPDWYVGNSIYYFGLKRLGWQPQTTEDKVHVFESMHQRDSLLQILDQTKLVLLGDMQSTNYRTVECAVYTFMDLGKLNAIPELIDVLNEKGTPAMAQAYLNCETRELEDAARNWATTHHYCVRAFIDSSDFTCHRCKFAE